MTFTRCQNADRRYFVMKFNETFRINEDFLIDEENRTFCYKKEGEYVIVPAKNIQSCLVMADVDNIGEEYFYIEEVPEIGEVHFVKDLSDFSKAVLAGDLVLTTHYLDENGEMRCHRKKYSSNDKTPYEIMYRINKLI